MVGDIDPPRRRNRFQCFGETEVQHFHDAVRPDLDVGGLQIAMDDALLVSGFQRFGDFSRDR